MQIVPDPTGATLSGPCPGCRRHGSSPLRSTLGRRPSRGPGRGLRRRGNTFPPGVATVDPCRPLTHCRLTSLTGARTSATLLCPGTVPSPVPRTSCFNSQCPGVTSPWAPSRAWSPQRTLRSHDRRPRTEFHDDDSDLGLPRDSRPGTGTGRGGVSVRTDSLRRRGCHGPRR